MPTFFDKSMDRIRQAGELWQKSKQGAEKKSIALTGEGQFLGRLGQYYFLSEFFERGDQKILMMVCQDEEEMEWSHGLLRCFSKINCYLLPPLSDQPDVKAQRARALHHLSNIKNNHDEKKIVIITCYQAIMKFLPPPTAMENIQLAVGENYSVADLWRKLLDFGYTTASEVRGRGEMVRHGGIIDIYPATMGEDTAPYRIDFFGNQVESIHRFSVVNQRRHRDKKFDSLTILPLQESPAYDEKNLAFRLREDFGYHLARDFRWDDLSDDDKIYYQPLLLERRANIFDYLPKDTILFWQGRMENQAHDYEHQLESDYEQRQQDSNFNDKAKKKLPPLPPAYGMIKADDFIKKAKDFFSFGDKCDDNGDGENIQLDSRPLNHTWFGFGVQDKNNRDATLQDRLIKKINDSATSLLVVAHNETSLRRWQSLLHHDSLPSVILLPQPTAKKIKELLQDEAKKIIITTLPLRQGEEWSGLTIITDHDVFRQAFRPMRSGVMNLPKGAVEKLIKDITTLKKDDLVAHLDYGIGQFLGLRPITAGGKVHECVALQYRHGDKLYLPIENLDRLQRYGDLPEPAPPLDQLLDRLGYGDWQSKVAKTREKIKELAQQLAKTAAVRKTIKADPLIVGDSDYLEFSSFFPYTETRDQELAINAVRHDLAQETPMDRLICGDVGFGKTEVALRASFCAVMSGKQVLVITPTTLLARQHYLQFKERFKHFSAAVKQLSRFVTNQDKKIVYDELANGKVDIVVGTHALLNKNIVVKNLGLVIVDEEHHFGVKQKERAREISKGVHFLSMSATPIPRSLQLSLHGIKELSMISTPPMGRLPIRTSVAPLQDFDLIRVIRNELSRGGQLFLVAPRIHQLHDIQISLRKLMPELNIGLAYGRMAGEDIDEVMTKFANPDEEKPIHALLSTNIIESGLDLPNVNTIIIFHGEQFGLAGLYQLRGRVGRSERQGYCYITYPRKKSLSPSAKQRLELLDNLSHLGAGFLLASHDLDMRGAGNLLGSEQSGHVREVGVELYQKMVMDEIAQLAHKNINSTGQAVVKHAVSEKIYDWTPRIISPLSIAIPNDYILDDAVRFAVYKELTDARDEKQLLMVHESLLDRFGAIPPAVNHLLAILRLKQLCYQADIDYLQLHKRSIIVSFRNQDKVQLGKLIAFIKHRKGKFLQEDKGGQKTTQKIAFDIIGSSDDKIITAGLDLMEQLAKMNQD